MWRVALVAVVAAAAGARALLLPWGRVGVAAPPAGDADAVVRRVREAAPELFMGTEELARRAGFALEEHRVVTDDGFTLLLHRLVAPPADAADADAPTANAVDGPPRGDPVFMMHGILCASHLWLLTGPEHALALVLARRGYDVWLGNARGNVYSRQHQSLSPRQLAYWNYSWHEMGMYDAPASIDYVLQATGRPSLYYFGHSMGNTVFYVMASSRPEYNAKVRLHVGLAPVVFMGQLRSPLARPLVPHTRAILRELERQGTPQLLPPSAARAAFLHLACGAGVDAAARRLCVLGFDLAYGPTHPGFNASEIPFYLAHVMEGTSARTAAHFVQNYVSGHFRQWEEEDSEANERRYGRSEPPDYELERVTAPSAIFYSDDDYLLHENGVKRLAERLPRVVAMHHVSSRPFNHMDFLLCPDAPALFYDAIFSLMERH